MGLLCDGQPLGWLLPGTVSMFFRTGQDRAQHWVTATALRALRLGCMAVTLLLPALRPDGTSAALTLEKVRVRASPVFTGGELTGLAVCLDLPARLAQGERPLSPEELDWIEREVGILEGQRAVRALELAQSMDADFCGMEARARNAQNARRLAAQWPEAFRGLDIRVSAVCRAERTMETMGR